MKSALMCTYDEGGIASQTAAAQAVASYEEDRARDGPRLAFVCSVPLLAKESCLLPVNVQESPRVHSSCQPLLQLHSRLSEALPPPPGAWVWLWHRKGVIKHLSPCPTQPTPLPLPLPVLEVPRPIPLPLAAPAVVPLPLPVCPPTPV